MNLYSKLLDKGVLYYLLRQSFVTYTWYLSGSLFLLRLGPGHLAGRDFIFAGRPPIGGWRSAGKPSGAFLYFPAFHPAAGAVCRMGLESRNGGSPDQYHCRGGDSGNYLGNRQSVRDEKQVGRMVRSAGRRSSDAGGGFI